MSEFTRENRYVVFKRSDIDSFLDDSDIAMLDALMLVVESRRIIHGKQPLRCVVVESDWPMYDNVWDMIESSVPSALERTTS